MEHYYANDNPQSTGEHEVHKEGCQFMPEILNRTYLGMFSSCGEALEAARQKYDNVDGCFFCANACHNR